MITFGVSSDGDRIAEADSPGPTGAPATTLIEAAVAGGARRLWLHGGDHQGDGFHLRGGYTLMRGQVTQPPAPLPEVTEITETATIRQIFADCYRGQWGHHQPRADYLPDPAWTHLGLRVAETWIGLCRVHRQRRYVDGPGIVPGHRVVDRYAQLLGGALGLLGPGPVEMESWGDEPTVLDRYQQMGLQVVTHDAGWEYRLPPQEA